MDKFRNKYRIPSARAQWWDYGWDGSYFITICTWKRRHLFGKIIDDQMIFSDLGKIADECWQKITEHAANVELGAHVVMPNHVHGILNLHNHTVPFKCVPPEFNDAEAIGQAGEFAQSIGQMRLRKPGKNTVSTIIGGYKSAVSKEAGKAGLQCSWQSRFHDHIIRDAEEHQRITDYILNNPATWKKDKFYGEPNGRR
jgi:REP element-mobilizing transposase RayT